MRAIRTILSRIGALLGEKRANREFDAELQEHLRLLAERFEQKGMSPEDAAHAARRQFGNAALVEQRQREARTFLSPGELWRDARFGVRMLRKHPGSTAAVIIALSLGIGMNACVFTFVNALLLRPPSLVKAPRQLLELWQKHRIVSGITSLLPLTYPDYAYYRDHVKSLSGLLAYDGDPEPVIWNRDGQGENVTAQLVSGNFFAVAGVDAALGRTFSLQDDQPANPQPRIVLSNAFWRQRLAGDPAIVGKTLMLNGAGYAVIGVAPPGFGGLLVAVSPDFWAPLSMVEQMVHDPGRLTARHTNWLITEGRIAPGQTLKSVQAEADVLAREIEIAHPDTNKDMGATIFAFGPVPGPARGYVKGFTALLMTVFGLVLVIACVNAAGLVLMKATGRAREMAIRSALGAGRRRLLRQMTIESLMLSLMAGGAAVLFAWWTSHLLIRLVPANLPVSLSVPLDGRVLAFTLLVALVTGVAFGLAPALRGARVDPVRVLKEEMQSGSYRRSRLRTVLMTGEIALCALLLFGATLCVRSLFDANSIDPGFNTSNLAMATLDPANLGYSSDRIDAFYRELMDRMRALPGVASVSYASHLPLSAEEEGTGVTRQADIGREGAERPADVFRVSPGYFATMGIALLDGREFTPADVEDRKNAIIVNDTLARKLWPGEDPIGKRVLLAHEKAPSEVVGVARTGKYRSLGEQPMSVVYLAEMPPRRVIVVRSLGNPGPLLDLLRREVQAVDPRMAATQVQTVSELMTFPLFPARTTGLLLGAAGILALILTWIGLFGVISYAVSQRTREIGVRMALGATRGDVLKLVIRQGLLVTGIGLVLGVGAALAASRLLSSLLYGIRPDDPATVASVSLGLIAAAMLACYLPARRAMRVDPMAALRYE